MAFLIGIIAHNYADILWHWGDNNEGFIRALSHDSSDAQDDFEKAHDFSDTGAEFYVAGRDAKLIPLPNWLIPASDLEKVYQKINVTANPLQIVACSYILFLEGIGVELIGYPAF